MLCKSTHLLTDLKKEVVVNKTVYLIKNIKKIKDTHIGILHMLFWLVVDTPYRSDVDVGFFSKHFFSSTGPYKEHCARTEVEEADFPPNSPLTTAVNAMRSQGYKVSL